MTQLTYAVNEIIGDHNVDKQMTDSRGDVSLSLQALNCQKLIVSRLPI